MWGLPQEVGNGRVCIKPDAQKNRFAGFLWGLYVAYRDKNILPVAGGLADQPHCWMQGIEVLHGVYAEHRRKIEDAKRANRGVAR